ncbi:hypothetical protein [Streptomyces sp. MUM 178J]|uniref:hypothetical protein n=1 Tax=Streptomyces sp. MUM 178J TaxID=2791991 RepID=UPI001F04B7D7|nr:hypothetical protein [Streptomyces sp. MUM 178J]WRQ81803.1 hypothetical protein I3F59_021940 [Streptomyces sp. MUM 178J]
MNRRTAWSWWKEVAVASGVTLVTYAVLTVVAVVVAGRDYSATGDDSGWVVFGLAACAGGWASARYSSRHRG